MTGVTGTAIGSSKALSDVAPVSIILPYLSDLIATSKVVVS
jgi:hypothetical protein